MNTLFEIVLPSIAVVILVLIVAFFASSETAYLSITKMMLRQMQKNDEPNKKNTPSKKIASLKKDTGKLLSLILIGINFVTSLASGLAAVIAINVAKKINISGETGSFIATFVIAFILIIFGEIVPKTLATVHPIKVASMFATPLAIMQKILFPIVWIFAKISGFLTFVLNVLWKDDKNSITEEELKSLIDVGETEGTLEHSEKKMLYKIFDFTDLRIHDIMRHRSLVKFISTDATFDEVLKIFSETGFSRIPVCEGDFENVKGMVYYKTLLVKSSLKKNKNFLQSITLPVIYVPETLFVTELLSKFKEEKTNFAIAIDETGSNIGIVTTDDIMRAVFGRSVHEDSMEISPEKRIKPISPIEYIIPGDMKIDDVNELLKLDLYSDNFDTLAGFLLEKFDRIPQKNEKISVDENTYKIENLNQRRIESVRVILKEPPKS